MHDRLAASVQRPAPSPTIACRGASTQPQSLLGRVCGLNLGKKGNLPYIVDPKRARETHAERRGEFKAKKARRIHRLLRELERMRGALKGALPRAPGQLFWVISLEFFVLSSRVARLKLALDGPRKRALS